MRNSDDIIKELINITNIDKKKLSSLKSEDIQKIISNTNKGMAISKMRKMGLSGLADKLEKMSDQELASLIGKNPAILKNLEKFIK